MNMKGKRFKQGAILTSVLLTGGAVLVLQLTGGVCGVADCAVLFASPVGTSDPEPPYATFETAADSIQTALDYAAAGDTVFVLAGLYREKVHIDKAVTLIGDGKDLCVVANPDASPRSDSETLVVKANAIVQGLTVTGGHYGAVLDADQPALVHCRLSGARIGVECRSGLPTISLCEIVENEWGGVRAKRPSSPSILQCGFRRNGVAIHCECHSAPIISHCVIIGNRGGIVTNGPVAYIQQCLVVFNGGGIVFGSDCDCDGLIWRCTIALNGYWDGVYMDSGTRGAILDECMVWSPPFGRIQGYVDPTNVTRTLANDADFESPGLLVTDAPGFVGWGSFNNADNPIHVDASAPPGGDGTKERPFRSIHDAMWSFDFRLGADSAAVSAFGHGGHGVMLQPIGYYADEPLAEHSGSVAVTIKVAPGAYVEPEMQLPQGSNVVAEGSSGPVLRPAYRSDGDSSRLSVRQGSLEHVTFDGYSAHCSEGTVADCLFNEAKLGVAGAKVTRCTFTGEDTKLWLRGAQSVVANCVFDGIPSRAVDILTDIANPIILNCTFYKCNPAIYVNDSPASLPPTVVNCIFSHNSPDFDSYVTIPVSYSVVPGAYPGEGNIDADPRFLDAERGDFRLSPGSPSIDGGDNSAPELPDADIAGMPRIMYGGNRLSVDMGAYEYYINDLKPGPGADETTLTWSSLADKTYSIFYSDDLLTWHVAERWLASDGNETTTWIDDGSKTGLPPSLAPRRFYRILENP